MGLNIHLGGIFSITGADFEKIGGFPNFWTWGYEDNIIYNKANQSPGLMVDRSVFFKIFDHNIVHMTDSLKRTINVNQMNSNDPMVQVNNNVNSVVNINHTIIGNKIIVNWFDISLPYQENIQVGEINLTDSPKSIQNMKRRIMNENKGIQEI